MTLPEYLKAKAETQEQFASSVGTTQANISKLCGKSPKISAMLAVRIEKATSGAVPVEIWPQFRVLSDRHASHSGEVTSIPSRHGVDKKQYPQTVRSSEGAA